MVPLERFASLRRFQKEPHAFARRSHHVERSDRDIPAVFRRNPPIGRAIR
jgi:hypothetical protein